MFRLLAGTRKVRGQILPGNSQRRNSVYVKPKWEWGVLWEGEGKRWTGQRRRRRRRRRRRGRRSCRCPPHPYSPLSRPSARPPVHHVYPMPLHHTGLRKVCVSPQIHINGEEQQCSLQHSTVDSISAKGWFSSALVGGGRSDKSKEVLPQ